MEGQTAGRTVTLYNDCGSAGGERCGKFHIYSLCEWVSSSSGNSCARVRWRHNEPFESCLALVCLARIDNKKIAQSKCKHNNNKHTYLHAYVQYTINTYTHTLMHTYVLCTHSPHKPFPSISLQFFKKLTPLTIVAKQQQQQQKQRRRWLRRWRRDVDASHSQKVRASKGKRQRRIVVEDDFNVFTKSKLDALL